MCPESSSAGALEAELRAKLDKHLATKSFRFNPDQSAVDNLITAMVKRHEKAGEFYCPCRVVTKNREQDVKIICPCVYHEDEVKNDGHCKCWLFVR